MRERERESGREGESEEEVYGERSWRRGRVRSKPKTRDGHKNRTMFVLAYGCC